MHRLPRFAVLVLCSLLCAGGAADARKQPAKRTSGTPRAQMCGGIANLPCPTGKTCFTSDAFPDAMGTCMSAQAAEAGRNRCAAVRCMALECGPGETQLVTPERCCGMCVPAPEARGGGGVQCRTVAECENLPHIQCVGSWSCERGQCKYTCEAGSPQ